MIDWVHLNGFKSFVAQRIPLGRLTVLSGLNNSGKSSAIQALRMISSANGVKGPYLSGLGGYSELKSNLTLPADPISISVSQSTRESHLVIRDGSYECSQSFSAPITQFLSADRHGPMVELPILGESESVISVGERGEFSAHFASILENASVASQLHHSASTSSTLKHQLAAWMNEVSPGIKLEFHIQQRFDASRLEVDGNRATNSGFGISYALPVLLSLLAMTATAGPDSSDIRAQQWLSKLSNDGGLLLVENPEAHLHPRGQTAIGKLLVAAAELGLQIVIETHSDHVLDGVRLGMRTSGLNEGDVRIFFFTKPREAKTEVTEIVLQKSGKLSAWPEGFFDQMTKNLRDLSSTPLR